MKFSTAKFTKTGGKPLVICAIMSLFWSQISHQVGFKKRLKEREG